MEIGTPEIVVVGVILTRLLVPLLIIRWPLPAIVACLLIDAADQSIFAAVAPEMDLTGYQGYDKALDIYYLVIAYISTLRNWTSQFAVYVARFLIYYRLVGVVLFEISGVRELLFIFPNTFEYFFIFYEGVRLFWDPRRMSVKLLVGATAFIWIVIKLPQEWWIHIAQLDTTDVIQEQIFEVPAGTPWLDTFAARPWVVVLAAVFVLAAAWVLWWLMKKLPARDRPLTIDADAEPGRKVPMERLRAERERMMQRLVRPGLFEKVALISLVSIIFGEMLAVHAGPLQLSLMVAIVVVANAVLSTLLERRGFGPGAAVRQFIVTGLLNVAIVGVMLAGFELIGDPAGAQDTGFFVLLITLLVTLYDRYRPEYRARFSAPMEHAGP